MELQLSARDYRENWLDACRLLDEREAEIERLRARISAAPVAIMDTRDALGVCAPTEDAFPALYALQGKRVRLVLDEVPNAPELTRAEGVGVE